LITVAKAGAAQLAELLSSAVLIGEVLAADADQPTLELV
jgi:hypothetical protein